MKKKLYIVLLSFSLVLALASAGVCFADSSQTAQIFQLGGDVPVFTQVIDDTTFAIFKFENFDQWTSSSVTDWNQYIWVPAFNDIDFACRVMTDGQPEQGFTLYFRQGDTFSQNRNLYIQNLTQGVCLKTVSSGRIYFGRYINASYLDYNSGGYISAFNMHDFTLGDSIVWNYTLTGEVADFSLSPGYALVIDGPCEIVERSYYINNSWDFTKNGNMRVNGAFENDLSATYIRDGYSPDLAYSRDDLIQWEALNSNLLGTASNYESYNGTLVDIAQGETYVIGYPQLYGFGNSNSRFLYTNSVNLVGHVYINYRERPSFRYVALESLSEFTNTGDFYTYSVFRPAVADVEGDVSEGSGGIVITPSDPLPSGGGNAGQPPVDEDGSLLGTISRFVNDIKRLLSSAVEAINTLVNDGSSFMQSIGTMFTWLPAPLITLIIAGFTILLVVGVLKVLWR